MVQLKREILLAAKTNATLLIEGKRGPAREVVANEVFSASARAGSGSSPSAAPPSRRSSSNPSFRL